MSRLYRRLTRFSRDPVFRRELLRPGRRRCALALGVLNGGFLLLLAWSLWRESSAGPGVVLRAAFDFTGWLVAGGALLSLCAHWLVPPATFSVSRDDYNLDTLAFLVRERRDREAVLRRQLAAALVPLALGLVPLALGAALVASQSPQHGIQVLAACAGAPLWLGLGAAVSLWASLRDRRGATALAYLLTSLVLPAAIGGVSIVVAAGCSRGHPKGEAVFTAALIATAGILVLGTAAVFWDLAHARLFPERRRSLWLDQPPPGLPESE
ncbi:MAG: hypothetical protein ACK47B_04880 [Armatimonadota bacterium]